ncbi:MAG: hypothetical protein UY10_C0023G0006 [Microgenomates group bacterium GW2011_GWA2_47_8]|nr:MAG: hypothetical protein UY10_C0023G0006 [Microgenomates group bacterium GW2011_GWA2_47_8]
MLGTPTTDFETTRSTAFALIHGRNLVQTAVRGDGRGFRRFDVRWACARVEDAIQHAAGNRVVEDLRLLVADRRAALGRHSCDAGDDEGEHADQGEHPHELVEQAYHVFLRLSPKRDSRVSGSLAFGRGMG